MADDFGGHLGFYSGVLDGMKEKIAQQNETRLQSETQSENQRRNVLNMDTMLDVQSKQRALQQQALEQQLAASAFRATEHDRVAGDLIQGQNSAVEMNTRLAQTYFQMGNVKKGTEYQKLADEAKQRTLTIQKENMGISENRTNFGGQVMANIKNQEDLNKAIPLLASVGIEIPPELRNYANPKTQDFLLRGAIQSKSVVENIRTGRGKIEADLTRLADSRQSSDQKEKQFVQTMSEKAKQANVSTEGKSLYELASNEGISGQIGKSGQQDRTIANTMTTAMSEAGISLENLSNLTKKGTIYTTAGAYDNLSDHGVLGATAKQLTQENLTSQNQQMYRSVMLPLVRQAVTIQSGGRYKITEGAVKQEMDAVMASAGQSHMTMLEKMAELKQTISKGAEASLAAGILNPKQEAIVRNNLEQLDRAIPWSVNDVVSFATSGGKAKDFGTWLKASKETVQVGGQSYSRPAGFTDEMWTKYKQEAGAQ